MAAGEVVDVAVTTDGVTAALTLSESGVNVSASTVRPARADCVVLTVPDRMMSPRGTLILEA